MANMPNHVVFAFVKVNKVYITSWIRTNVDIRTRIWILDRVYNGILVYISSHIVLVSKCIKFF